MPHIPAFRPGLAAIQAHIALKTSVAISDQAQHCAVLWFEEIMRRKLYREMGFSTMRAYALEELGFSPTRAGDFIRLAKKLDELPVVKKEMAAGKLGYTKAREIAMVASPANEKAWVKEAQERSRCDLVATVKRAKAVAKQQLKANPDQIEMMPFAPPAAPPVVVPVQVEFELTPLQSARYEAMLAKIDHRGSKAELLLEMLEALVVDRENAPRGRLAIPAKALLATRFMCINARIALATRCQRRKANETSLRRRQKVSVATPRSTHPASATPPRFRRGSGARC